MDFASFTCRNVLECPTTNTIRYRRLGILNYVSKCFTKACKEGGRENLETSRISQSFMQRFKEKTKLKKAQTPHFLLVLITSKQYSVNCFFCFSLRRNGCELTKSVWQAVWFSATC